MCASQIGQDFGPGRVRSSLPPSCLILKGTPLPPMVEIWEGNVKDQMVPPANPIASYGPGVVPVIDMFRWPPATSMLRTIKLNQREHEWRKHTQVKSKVR